MVVKNQAEESFIRMNRFFKVLVVVDLGTIVLCRVGVVPWGLGLPICFGAILAMFAGFVFTMHKLTKIEEG